MVQYAQHKCIEPKYYSCIIYIFFYALLIDSYHTQHAWKGAGLLAIILYYWLSGVASYRVFPLTKLSMVIALGLYYYHPYNKILQAVLKLVPWLPKKSAIAMSCYSQLMEIGCSFAALLVHGLLNFGHVPDSISKHNNIIILFCPSREILLGRLATNKLL